MSGASCIICAANIPEGAQTCPRCASIFEPYKDLMNAMYYRTPVEYNGVKYGCISAFIIRARACIYKPQERPYVVQVELMSGKGRNITIADPNKIKVLEAW